jgi:recombination protein RecA
MSKLDILVKQINKQAKEDIASRGIPTRHFQKIPFSSPMVNYMTYGGVPRGRIIEFAGEENGGKTTTALDIVANAQKLFDKEYENELESLQLDDGSKNLSKEQQTRLNYLHDRGVKKVVYCDCENTLDVEWAEKLGVDTDDIILLKPMSQTAEQIFEMLLQMIETDEVGLVVLDSLGVMLSAQAYEKTMEEKTYGGIAAPLTLFSKKAELLCTKYDCTLIGINQMREDMSGFGRFTTTGGKGWKHNCSLRLAFRKGDYIDENNNSIKRSSTSPAGNLIEIAIEKTKVCKPDRRNGYYTLNYTNGVDIISDTVELATYYDIIQKGGSWYSIIDTETGEIMQAENYIGVDEENNPQIEMIDLKFQGRPALLECLKQDEELFNLIYEQVMKKLEE